MVKSLFLLPPGICFANLKDNKTLMKIGLGLVLVGHVNFLLGALVHGAVLRHINVHAQARTMVYAIANVIAIVAGLLVSVGCLLVTCPCRNLKELAGVTELVVSFQGIIGGITAIVLSKNKKNRILVNKYRFLLVICWLLLERVPCLCDSMCVDKWKHYLNRYKIHTRAHTDLIQIE